jgi:hypothetical protein
MSILNIQLHQVQQKLQRLIKSFTLLQRENIQLKKELEKKNTLLTKNEQIVFSLQQQVNALRLTKEGLSLSDKKQLEKDINTYLKEIDRCLSLLNT